jgi:hypothetical protein
MGIVLLDMAMSLDGFIGGLNNTDVGIDDPHQVSPGEIKPSVS